MAEGLGLKGPRGWAFRDVSLRAGAGALVAIEGPSGTGRTCLLLALTGRMKTREGHAEVGGLRLPRKMAAVRRIAALGQVPGVSELDPSLTVAEHLRERALLQRRFDGSVRALLRRPGTRAAETRARIAEALTAAGLDLAALPKGERTSVRDLERLEALRLSIALALMGRPRLIGVDDTDLKLSDADRAEAWALLRAVAAAGTTVLAVCSEAPADALRLTTVGTAATAPAEAPGTATEPGTTEGPDAATGPSPAEEPAAAAATGPGAAGEPAAAGKHAAGKHAAATEDDITEEGAADALAETGRA
ncbi:ATP-binding cassette domain-containing protein [Streptomyces griseus]|uniref:ATP-binding cassette domain-containing protein n=1 Tax=Streptomyces griseus TaxID=1911 RepID=UPI0004C879FB|nr:ATP-binding cassette domain-containing protein [Streptomyces griseus]